MSKEPTEGTTCLVNGVIGRRLRPGVGWPSIAAVRDQLSSLKTGEDFSIRTGRKVD